MVRSLISWCTTWNIKWDDYKSVCLELPQTPGLLWKLGDLESTGGGDGWVSVMFTKLSLIMVCSMFWLCVLNRRGWLYEVVDNWVEPQCELEEEQWWCSGNKSGVTLRLGGKYLSLKNIESGDVGAVWMFDEPKDRWDGRRLPIDPFQLSDFTILAFVRTMLGCLLHVE